MVLEVEGGFCQMKNNPGNSNSLDCRTLSEQSFESYLRENGCTEFERHPSIAGNLKRPDYKIKLDGKSVYFEVKEFTPSTRDYNPCLDMYGPIREKINAASKQFSGLKGPACVVVIANPQRAQVYLDELAVVGSMFGDLGWTFELDAKSKVLSESRPAFLGKGKMTWRTRAGNVVVQNTTTSAIAILEEFPLGSRRFDVKRFIEERKTGTKKRPEELLEEFEASQGTPEDLSLHRRRLLIFENPYAKKRMPLEFGRGPFDERIGIEKRRFKRLFAGELISELEAEERKAGIVIKDPLGLRFRA
jgi:hypothetical protein